MKQVMIGATWSSDIRCSTRAHWVFVRTAPRDGDLISNGIDVAVVGYECDGALVSDQLDAGEFLRGGTRQFAVQGL
jgi:hypothetical protein